MRFRTAAASAALVLCATAGAAACSSSSDAADSSRPANPSGSDKSVVDDVQGRIETGKRQAGAPEAEGRDSTECATSAAEIPQKCALDVSFSESTDGAPAAGEPDAR
ncbi:hypothetical protein [Streptomyces flavofungini]|uniref:hypothetical protein n=1 Tax=Streptomyces flavofungini TaxID=68200 RepID=UPI0025B1496D|nr:hypothetical protein [Streptomyces flavofungini]WJV44270.1 hypothetical protein QUY26_01170 [Streptomyces flavofungini]